MGELEIVVGVVIIKPQDYLDMPIEETIGNMT
jgi:hypothetical protein